MKEEIIRRAVGLVIVPVRKRTFPRLALIFFSRPLIASSTAGQDDSLPPLTGAFRRCES